MRKFRAVLLHDDSDGHYGAGIEERVDGQTVWIASLYLGPMPSRKQAQNELINVIEQQLAPGDEVTLKIPDFSFYKRGDEFAPRFTIHSERLKKVVTARMLCEDALKRRSDIIEKL
ncbi:hypothetical protein HHO41_04830 [Bacillus sp. DNRA2]|uniref:hypothetical protein n=1 Tax=Bacillus sp. DNRA2 TaxID=2723053 RepID=UPI00145C67C6|nr:hypothetical protein [Bacillus sp. DNRA2]NMD69605.1 hypothetical protein [Bacillus sp. DNRA2]